MSNKQLLILGIVATAMLSLAIFQSYVARPKSAESPEELFLVQGMPPVDKIGKIVLGLQENEVTLLRSGEKGFVVANKDNYPANNAKVRKLLENCLKIRTSEVVTQEARNHEALGVNTDNPDGPDVVRFYRQTEETGGATEFITGIVLGDHVQQSGDQYVRRFEDDTVYRMEEPPSIDTNAMDYIDETLLEISRGHIVKVTVTGPQGSYSIVKDSTGKAYLPEIPQGKKAKERDVGQTFATLSNLRFDNVQANSEKTQDLKYDVAYQCLLENATLYSIELAEKDNKHYIKCQAGYTDKSIEALLQKRQRRQTSEEKIKEDADKLKAYDEAQKFTQRHSPWVYEISGWQAGKLTKQLSDLLEDVEKQEPPEKKNP